MHNVWEQQHDCRDLQVSHYTGGTDSTGMQGIAGYGGTHMYKYPDPGSSMAFIS